MSAQEALLRQQIEDAFSDVPRPDDSCIAYAPEAWETAELSRDFRGMHWKDVPAQRIRQHAAHLSLLSPEALHYYLPAYLLAALTDPDVRDFLLSQLSIPDESHPELRTHFKSRFDTLPPQQRNVVQTFLRRMRDEASGPIARRHWSQALETYWDTF
ncbi:hypothetical protein OV207_06680 [Corallococcus sp. BB11-1]|uniref:DUF6714 family protein n=1 Tax=Corallococcus sp. BB11-1 TaxID=2996783 RepID=UPI0010E02879|nr:DUF6714 family protein [Corallococcus sp. BB11-1]MCY1031136.1 hypothetical protein [Corallococcus sp. BB11-1]RYZ14013.1 MAG: hypothetical protein EOO70_08070 [Myxococcaceae bacterium]